MTEVKQLKNRKERMNFLQENDNWTVAHADQFLKTLSLEVGEHEFIRVLGYMNDKFYPDVADWRWVGQFEVVFDGNNDFLEPRSNSDICDILSKEK